jgi:hypothetical protein
MECPVLLVERLAASRVVLITLDPERPLPGAATCQVAATTHFARANHDWTITNGIAAAMA